MLGLRTLVLNADMSPINMLHLNKVDDTIIPAEDAVTRVVNGTCFVVEEYDREILTPTLRMKWPSVVACMEYVSEGKAATLTHENLYYRDHGLCAYCHKELTLAETTIDHVMAASHGGPRTWENSVAACSSCNSRKGNLKAEGEWAPKHRVYQPTYWDLVNNRRKFPIRVADDAWVPYIQPWQGDITVALV